MTEREACKTLQDGGYIVGLNTLVITKQPGDKTEMEDEAMKFLLVELNYKIVSQEEHYSAERWRRR